jgi:hypothetical protein
MPIQDVLIHSPMGWKRLISPSVYKIEVTVEVMGNRGKSLISLAFGTIARRFDYPFYSMNFFEALDQQKDASICFFL